MQCLLLRLPLVLEPRLCWTWSEMTVSTEHTTSFYITFASDVSLCLSRVCVSVCLFCFAYPVPQKSSWEVQEFYNWFFFFFFLCVCVFLYFSPMKKETKKFTRVRSVPFSWNPFFFRPRRVHRLSSFYWIPLKRHIANTMAKSCGKREGRLEGAGRRRRIPVISKQRYSFMIPANWTSSEVKHITVFLKLLWTVSSQLKGFMNEQRLVKIVKTSKQIQTNKT